MSSELVEMAVVPPPDEAGPEPARPPEGAPTIETAVRTSAIRAALAEVAARPGGRDGATRSRRTAPAPAVPRVSVASITSDEPLDSRATLEVTGGEVVTGPPSPEPVDPGSFGAPGSSGVRDPMATGQAAASPSSLVAGEGIRPNENGAGPGEGGEGAGTGAASGDGAGDAASDAWGKELRARILGDVRVDLKPRDGRRVLSHEEATTLRIRDVFPRMPEALWPGWRPYLVVLEVCVDELGAVGEVNLLSWAAPRLDRMVAAAARSWRYQPLVVGGAAVPFCHAVVIKYEPW